MTFQNTLFAGDNLLVLHAFSRPDFNQFKVGNDIEGCFLIECLGIKIEATLLRLKNILQFN